MRQSGVEASVLKAHASGCPVFGICGGYQMLGEYLEDPHGVEEGGSMRGMGLLPMRTVFTEEKTRTRWMELLAVCMAFYRHFPVWLLADMKSTWDRASEKRVQIH